MTGHSPFKAYTKDEVAHMANWGIPWRRNVAICATIMLWLLIVLFIVIPISNL